MEVGRDGGQSLDREAPLLSYRKARELVEVVDSNLGGVFTPAEIYEASMAAAGSNAKEAVETVRLILTPVYRAACKEKWRNLNAVLIDDHGV